MDSQLLHDYLESNKLNEFGLFKVHSIKVERGIVTYLEDSRECFGRHFGDVELWPILEFMYSQGK